MRRNEISAVMRWRGFLLKTREKGFVRRGKKKRVRTENTEGAENTEEKLARGKALPEKEDMPD
jgi:hypothetical protein